VTVAGTVTLTLTVIVIVIVIVTEDPLHRCARLDA
jgi:hypothetical protein